MTRLVVRDGGLIGDALCSDIGLLRRDSDKTVSAYA